MKKKKKKNRKKTLLIDIRKYGKIFFLLNFINIEIIKLTEIYSLFFLDRFILMELLYSLLKLS